MLKWILGILGITFVASLIMVFLFGIQPKPVRLMNPTEFENSEQVGAVVYRRLIKNIRPHNVIILGSHPLHMNYERIWLGFLKVGLAEGFKLKRLIVENGLRKIPLESVEQQKFSQQEILGLFDDNSYASVGASGSGVTVIHTTSFSSAQLADSLAAKIKRPVLTISQLDLVVSADQLARIQPQCESSSSVAKLGCISKRVSQQFFRKNLNSAKLTSVLQQFGSTKYFLFVYEPH